jgi:hypothetical protein
VKIRKEPQTAERVERAARGVLGDRACSSASSTWKSWTGAQGHDKDAPPGIDQHRADGLPI